MDQGQTWHVDATLQASSPTGAWRPCGGDPRHAKGDPLTTRGIHGNPEPLLGRFLLDKAGQFIRFHCQASQHDGAVTGEGLDMQMIRQCLNALNEKTQEPLEGDPYRATNAP